MDPEWIKSMDTKYHFKFHDQTSNQFWVDVQLGHPSNQELLLQTARELKDEDWMKIYTRMVYVFPSPDTLY